MHVSIFYIDSGFLHHITPKFGPGILSPAAEADVPLVGSFAVTWFYFAKPRPFLHFKMTD